MMFDRRTFLRGASAAGFFALPAMAATGPVSAATGPAMTVTKSPTCGCCTGWAEFATRAGFDVTLVDIDEVAPTKQRLGVPEDLWGCHTAEVEGYVIEGHVPFEAVAKLLEERPDVTGIAAPGMPMGSPGMGWDPEARYDVFAFGGTAGAGTIYFQAGRRA